MTAIQGLVWMGLFLLVFHPATGVRADWFTDSPPPWEPLLRGGELQLPARNSKENSKPIVSPRNTTGQTTGFSYEQKTEQSEQTPDSASFVGETQAEEAHGENRISPINTAGLQSTALQKPASVRRLTERSQKQHTEVILNSIPPLYRSPELPGEGVWQSKDLPTGPDGKPVMWKTSYRPSVEYPNAIVHMLVFDMKRLSMRLYLGSAEPAGSAATSKIAKEDWPRVLAVTNAFWKQKHSGEAGTIYEGRVIKNLAPGLATLVVYQDDSVDILEWHEGIPVSLIRYAKQLRHLIVKDGKVVESVIQAGRIGDSEIGLGFLLVEDPTEQTPPFWYGWGGWQQPEISRGPEWFIATRSAFGIRPDGNLVFAVGHHISTKDLAKALVLAGCERAIHGDANPHNVLGNLYHVAPDGRIVKKERLSPEQKSYTVDRYVDKSYTSDFFAFLFKPQKGTPGES